MQKAGLMDRARIAADKLESGVFLAADEVTALLDISISTLHRLPLPSIRIGRQLRYDPQDIQRLIETHKEPIAA